MSKDPIAAVMRYARQVVEEGRDGERPCGQLEIGACRRFLDDLAFQGDDDFDWIFHKPAAIQAIEMVESLPHTKGKWLKQRLKLELEPWQLFNIANIYGWFHKAEKTLRFTDIYIEVARKNAKTTLMSACAVIGLIGLGEAAPEVFLGATSTKQASIAFNMARSMIMKTPGLADHFGLDVRVHQVITDDLGVMEALPHDPGDGSSPSFAGIDEYHEHKDNRLVNAMQTGMGSRDDPQIMQITTAGTNFAGPCYDKRTQVAKMLEGKLEMERTFGIIYSMDPDDDWQDFENWKKANPNYGVSVSESYLRGQYARAMRSARERNIILTKNANKWMHALSGYFDMAAWAASDVAITQDVDLEELKTARRAGAVDLASKLDLTAQVDIYELERDDGPLYVVVPHFYLPEAQALHPDKGHYADFMDRGELKATGGEMIDYAYIEEDIARRHAEQNYECMMHDEHGAVQLAQNLEEKYDVPIMEFVQRARYFTEPMRMFAALIVAGRVRHFGNRCMTWCMSNTLSKDFADRTVMPRRNPNDKSQKIDGAVAAIMAFAHFHDGETDHGSYLDDNDLMVIA